MKILSIIKAILLGICICLFLNLIVSGLLYEYNTNIITLVVMVGIFAFIYYPAIKESIQNKKDGVTALPQKITTDTLRVHSLNIELSVIGVVLLFIASENVILALVLDWFSFDDYDELEYVVNALIFLRDHVLPINIIFTIINIIDYIIAYYQYQNNLFSSSPARSTEQTAATSTAPTAGTPSAEATDTPNECPYCGHHVYDDAKYCGKCGRELQQDEEELRIAQERKNLQLRKETNFRALWVFYILLVVVTVLLIYVSLSQAPSRP